ncbi:hypothetical protein [Jejuia pallidilutea]|nr:hypothetical protein [Jejuia pallidilutea]
MKTYTLFLVLIICLVSNCSSKDTLKQQPPPCELRVSEGFENPIGFYDSMPTFSWKLPQDTTTKTQTAYTIVVASKPELLPNNPDVWNSGKVASSQSVFVKYEGKPLKSRQNVFGKFNIGMKTITRQIGVK